MGFPCGCDVLPASSVTTEVLKKHLVHTLAIMLFWELLRRRNGSADRVGKLKLSQARLDYIEAVIELYPEAAEAETPGKS